MATSVKSQGKKLASQRPIRARLRNFKGKEKVSPRAIEAPNAVTIFGAGITGLSAAHELVERGFRVQVWEPHPSERSAAMGCDVGGMARTQWCSVPWPEGAPELGARREPEEWKLREASAIVELPWVFYLRDYRVVAAVGRYEFSSDEKGIRKILAQMAQSLFTEDSYESLRGDGDGQKKVVYCEVQRRTAPDPAKLAEDEIDKAIGNMNKQLKGLAEIKRDPDRRAVGNEAARIGAYTEQVTTHLVKAGGKDGPSIEFRVSLLDGFPDGLPQRFQERISFRIRERWLPGEHGFRFFPAFYRHLFDTMKRTPILEPALKSELGAAQERSVTVNANPEKYVETGRTVFDNLRPTESQALAFEEGGLPAVLSRSAPKSLSEVLKWLRVIFKHPPEDPKEKVQGGYGLSVRDTALFALKMFQYMTSCEARRAEYGKMSWLEYLGGRDAYSSQFVKLVNDSPKALVAMDAKTCDARTQGSIFTQLMLDNTRSGGFRDGTLSGPTSVAWLQPWRRYLEAQGVEFIHGELRGFEKRTDPDGHTIVWPQVSCYEPRYLGAEDRLPALAPGYFLLALPPLAAKKMAESYREVGGLLDDVSDLHRMCEMRLMDAPDDGQKDEKDDVHRADPTGALRHMIGIQYYFDQDAYWLDGHYYLPLSPWGISAISQARFWQDKADWEHGYRGVLSVGITSMDALGKNGRKAWESTPTQIAEEVWRQMSSALNHADEEALPQPRYFHLDFNLAGNRRVEPPIYQNKSPLLVNLPGEWEKRPGHLVAPDWLGAETSMSGYSVTDGIVLAGNYMKTFTRLTTMEAANESARHAVNAILADRAKRDHQVPCTPCDIWPIEDREVDDFDLLKELDETLYGRGLGHFVEILELDDAVVRALRGGGPKTKDVFDPLWILAELDRIFGQYGRKVIDQVMHEGAQQ